MDFCIKYMYINVSQCIFEQSLWKNKVQLIVRALLNTDPFKLATY